MFFGWDLRKSFSTREASQHTRQPNAQVPPNSTGRLWHQERPAANPSTIVGIAQQVADHLFHTNPTRSACKHPRNSRVAVDVETQFPALFQALPPCTRLCTSWRLDEWAPASHSQLSHDGVGKSAVQRGLIERDFRYASHSKLPLCPQHLGLIGRGVYASHLRRLFRHRGDATEE